MFGQTKHCPVCGMDVMKDSPFKRYGKYFCSDEHAQQYTQVQKEKESNRGSGGGCCC